MAEIGLYENRLRYYSPDLGRFIQPDPARFNGGQMNFYSYLDNDPLLFTDPTGTTAAIKTAMFPISAASSFKGIFQDGAGVFKNNIYVYQNSGVAKTLKAYQCD